MSDAPRSAAFRILPVYSGGVASRPSLRSQQFRTSRDDSENVVEVMREAPGQAAHRFHLLALAQMLFGAFLRGDIPCNCRGSDDLASGLTDRRDGNGNIQATPVFGDAHSVVMLKVLATADSFQDLRDFVRAILWRQKRYVPAEISSGA